MTLQNRFDRLISEKKWFSKGDKLLVAVSGGVDSMALLELLRHSVTLATVQISVVHINHRLREISEKEALFVREYCYDRELTYHEGTWRREDNEATSEDAARNFRYAFFSQVMLEEKYTQLLTAHHADDQAETVLMKLIAGGRLDKLASIKEKSQRQGMEIIRPLLSFSKEELRLFAKQSHLSFMEDESNTTDLFLRNRVRQKIVPKMKEENPKFLKHIHNLVKQIEYTSRIVDEKIQSILPTVVKKTSERTWELDLPTLLTLNEEVQYFFLVKLWKDTLVKEGVQVSDAQLERVLAMFRSKESYQKILLGNGWYMNKSYQKGYLISPVESDDVQTEAFYLKLDQSHQLTRKEWIFIQSEDDKSNVPDDFAKWTRTEWSFEGNQTDFPLLVRRRQAGDRIRYNQAGNHKKVSRVLIDQKVPHKQREDAWVIESQSGENLGILPIRKSYLSIQEETDKIHYRLIYLKNE